MDHPYVTRVELGNATVVSPVGEFDISTVEILREAMLEALKASPRLALDLSGVTFLDSLALGAIVSAGKRAREDGGWVRLVNPAAYVRRALKVTQIDTVLGLYDTAQEAVDHDDTAVTDVV